MTDKEQDTTEKAKHTADTEKKSEDSREELSEAELDKVSGGMPKPDPHSAVG
jgi:bacteriocin-like protein